MRINNVDLFTSGKTQQNKTFKNKSYNTSPPQTSFSALALPSGNLGRSMLHFKGLDTQNEVIEEYFKLPKGAHPDEYQIAAARALAAGDDVLVTAPTGTGKTAIGHYAISKNLEEGKRNTAIGHYAIINNLAEGKRSIYTTPLKALSNQKFRELQERYGKENVGLMTGDIVINPKAKILVMTTEIYTNMAISAKRGVKEAQDQLKDVKTVILDELHYLGDIDRGQVWENAIMATNKDTQILSLSATIGNNKEMTNWMAKSRGKKVSLINVPESKRHVPLEFHNELLTSTGKMPDEGTYISLVRKLKEEDKLPAGCFIFSKKMSKKVLTALQKAASDDKSLVLTTEKQRNDIKKIVAQYKKDGKYLGESLNYDALEKGYAIHNSGMLPAQKELVEELCQKKLLKLVISTETMAAGVNMPFRTTIISSTQKPTSVVSTGGESTRIDLSPNMFKQMGGRAGRRGIDTNGFVYTMPVTEEQLGKFAELIASEPDALQSHFAPNYSEIASYHQYSQDDKLMEEYLGRSFMAYDEDETVAKQKANALLGVFKGRRRTLERFGFITPEHKLTQKGLLLSKLNGYTQIPIINMIYDKQLPTGNPSELAACVAGMAHTNEDVAFNLEQEKEKLGKGSNAEAEVKEFKSGSIIVDNAVKDFDEYLAKYNHELKTVPGHLDVAQDTSTIKHLFSWAVLNNKNNDSRGNWQKLYRGLKGRIDEGLLFREINQTRDLLKQIGKIADAGCESLASATDKESIKQMKYYSSLRFTAKKAMALISRDPIQEAIHIVAETVV